MKTFNERVAELKELKVMLAELESEVKRFENEIKAEMEAEGKEEIICGKFIVRYKEIKSNRVDTTALKKELPEIAEKFTKTTTAKRFTIV